MQTEQIANLKGKVTSRRVLDVDIPSLESTVESRGKYREVEVNETLTFVASPQPNEGLRGVVKGIILTKEGNEVATYKGEAVGVINSAEEYTRWKISVFYNTKSTGKLSFLNNTTGILEAKIDSDQNFSANVWEWK